MRSLAGLGHPSLIAALAFAAVALVLCALGAHRRRDDLALAGTRALYATAGFTALAAVALVHALMLHDFSVEYVVNYSSESLSGGYLFSALWGGMEGSLLFWTLLLSAFSALAVRSARRSSSRLAAWAGAVLAGVSVFFLLLLVLPADPFTKMSSIPPDGNGLNPLLQSPGMVIHPPLLYTGFVGFSIPFAFAIAALLAGRSDDSWFTSTRRWTLFAWSALSIGIVLGGAWAYTELGWGGYWAWDPVENASFMPWLTATAFLHSVVIQEKRRMFKVWNVSLIVLTYVLAIFGTFLTRSGILSSIHTFTEGPIGKWFLPFLALMLIGGLGIVAWRLDSLRGENRFDALLSRESAFLANNVLFLAAAFTVLWGTIYPIVAEIVTGDRLAVGPPFFNSVFVPIGLALLLLTGIGPLISWRRMSRGAFARMVRAPLGAGAVTAVALWVAGVDSTGALLAFSLCAFTTVAIAAEFGRGSRIYRTREGLPRHLALARAVLRNRRRYGGYVVHLGVVLIVIGFAGSAGKVERNAILDRGEAMRVGDYRLVYEGFDSATTDEKNVYQATIGVFRGDDRVGELYPQRNLHLAQNQPQSEVAIRSTPVEDLYVVVTGFGAGGDAEIRAFVNPLTWWIWAGAAVMLGGMVVLLSGGTPRPSPAVRRAPVREPAVATQ
ncbi:MAG TPA: heme lyase CcmF/NrfE family subunit [Actinomycetota bacterium]|nr:heme lyase CcmF/NrfE family subunit [Actinomycetota bacterium]